ncbi:MAG: flippase-like domain-containing protein, partial [Gemmatimonadaceae bacterium]|nr:flippase-like domain-containing protein [Acetobacteraceae bacterium]
MKWGAALGTLFGLAIAAWLLASFGIREIGALVAQAGWGLVVVVLFHWSQILFSAFAWRALGGTQVSLWDYVVLRWIREAVNNLLPVAQVGGQVVGARLLRRRGVPMADAVAGSVGDMTTE